MKTSFKATALYCFLSLAFIIPPKNSITGKWITHEQDGSKIYIDFTGAGTFSYTNKGKLMHHGKYKQHSDTFLIDDGECGKGYWAKYKLSFVDKDSVTFNVIDDTCSGRMQSIDGGGLKRMK